jgi:hypothetical protein
MIEERENAGMIIMGLNLDIKWIEIIKSLLFFIYL